MILEYLPLRDALAVRLSSRDFASLGLRDTFWRPRFLPGRDLDYVLEARPYLPSLQGKGRTLFCSVRRLSHEEAAVNRRRVYGLASSLCDLIRQAETSTESCLGDSYHHYCCGEDKREFTWVNASRFGLHEPWSLQGVNGRSLRVPARESAIFISTVNIYGCRYVSGIRIRKGRDERGERSVKFGYQHPLNETLLVDSGQSQLRIHGFLLALDFHGIRGIAVMTQHAGSLNLSGWAGDHDGLPKRRLVLSSSERDIVEILRGTFGVSQHPLGYLVFSLFSNNI
jgi:hypothetical protein